MVFFRRKRQVAGASENPLFGNTIVPTSVGPKGTTITTSISMTADTNAFTQGPNPEPYLTTGESKDPFRVRARPLHLQPEIPVQEPWATSSVYVNNVNSAPGQFKNQVLPAVPQNPLRYLAPPMTTQRDNLYDDANFHRLQKFTFVTPSQRYFNMRTPLPEFTTPSMPTHSVITGNNQYYPSEMRSGWEQTFVPEPGMRTNQFATSPPWLLSTPLNVKTRIYSEYDTNTTRRPIKAKSPKRVRSGG